MIRHYLKVAFRNLMKYKTQSLVSIIGLAVGFTCFALSALWIRYEMTYDNFHEGAERIYLAGNKFRLAGDGFSHISSSLLTDYIIKNYPEVEKACHIKYTYGKNVKYENLDLEMLQLEVDSNFISMFNITVLSGDNHLQMDKEQIAITDKAAQRIFGDENPIGKRLVFPQQNDAEMTIVAVVKSWKGHSQYPFDILLPFYDSKPDWGVQSCYTLFRIRPGSNVNVLEQKLSKYEIENGRLQSAPIALLSTLRSTHPNDDINVKFEHIRLFTIIGALVIICGLCNYLTMLITRIRMRKRELALRKVNGASTGSLLALLLSELIVLLVISLGVGIMLVELILPVFKRMSQINENTSFFYGEVFIYMLLLIVITVGISTLLIKYVSKQTLLSSINHKYTFHFSGWFYKSSILFQLFISIGFVFCTFVMMKQLHSLLNTKELGLERHNVGIVTSSGELEIQIEKALDQMPEVTKRLNGFYTPIPKQLYSSLRVKDWEDKTNGEQYLDIEDELLNQEYVDFFEIELLEGSMLDEKDGEEIVLINEAAVKAFGWKNPLGKRFRDYTVKGVIKDICYNAPIHPVAPAMFSYSKANERKHIIFKVQEGSWKAVSERIAEESRKLNLDNKYTLHNMEEVYDDYMKSEETLSKLLGIVSCVCIIIAVFGIFSLVTLSCQQRRKEIAIRKVNGASARLILNLFFKEYLLLLVMASCIAFPLGYVIMKRWLENYVKQTPVNLWIYIGIFAGMLLVIFSSIVWRVWKAAVQNPAEVIKSE